MDPRIYSGRSGPSPDSSNGEEGVNYLRRLKGSEAEAVPADAAAKGKLSAPTTAVGSKERRKSPRLRCSGSVEFRTLTSDVRMWGTLTDISLHGCYVEMQNTFSR